MNNDPNTHLGYAENSSRLSDRAVLEVPEVDSLPRSGAETFNRLEQRPTLIALLYLFHWIEGDQPWDQQTSASRLVPMVVSGKVRNSPIEPAAKLDFARGRSWRRPYPSERFLDDFLSDVIVGNQHVRILMRRT